MPYEVPPAPLDPAEVALALAPFGSSRMLPRGGYRRRAVLAWEREHLFGGWMCVGRSERRPGRAGCARSRSGEYGVLLTRDRDGVLRAFENACRHRGHELLPCGGSADGARRSSARTTPGPTGYDGSLLGAPRLQGRRGLRQVDARPQAGARCRSGTAGSSSTGPAAAEDFEDAHRRARGRSSRRTTRRRW